METTRYSGHLRQVDTPFVLLHSFLSFLAQLPQLRDKMRFLEIVFGVKSL